MRGNNVCFYGDISQQKSYVVTIHYSSLNEMVLMVGHKICFYGKI